MQSHVRTIVGLSAAMLAAPVTGQVVKAPHTLPDTKKDGKIKLDAMASKMTPPMKKGTTVVACPHAAEPLTYILLNGTAKCPATRQVAELAPASPFAVLDQRSDWWGVNLSGLEFKDELSVKVEDIDFYSDAGVKSIRLPVKRDRLATEEKRAMLDALIKRGTDRGILMVIDEHSYGNIGDPRIRDFWLSIAPRYKGNPLVAFDLQNEPGGGTWETWGPDSRTLIQTLRTAGVDNLLILEWRQSSGASRADKEEAAGKPCYSALCSLNRAGMFTLADLDPLKRTWLSPHRYFDKDGSGTSAHCRTDLSTSGAYGSSVSLARKFGAKLYLGEFAWGRYADNFPASCQNLAPPMVEYLKKTPEFVGGASWGWGPHWAKSYTFRGEHPNDRGRTWATINGRLVLSLWGDK